MAYGLSNSHVTDDVTWTLKVLWGSTVGYPSDSLASCFLLVWSLSRNNWGSALPETLRKKLWPFLYMHFLFLSEKCGKCIFHLKSLVDGVGYQKTHSGYSKHMCWHVKTEKCIAKEFSNDPE